METKYLYYLADAFLNNLLETMSCHYFQRGIQNIHINREKINESVIKANFLSVTNSKEMARAMAYKCSTVFFTFTLNLRKHPGPAALMKTIDNLFPDKNSEEHKPVMQTFVPVFMRIWNFTAQLILEYLSNSSEQILGEIEDYWGRVELQNYSTIVAIHPISTFYFG